MIELHPVERGDVEVFFAHKQDPAANWMAASTSKDPSDRGAFVARWERMLGDPTIAARTIRLGDTTVGYVASFVREGNREVAYWLGREHWGNGIATAALSRFLAAVTERPLHARAATDNMGSLRVLAKCGFREQARARFFSGFRGTEVDEVVMVLEA